MTAEPLSDAAHSSELRRSALRSILASAACAVAALVAAHVWLAPGGPALLLVPVLLAALMLLLLNGLGVHPHAHFGPANQVTLLRAELVVLLAGIAVANSDPRLPAIATAIATGAATLDALDGWLARRKNVSSRYGARFDMETDAALILVLCVLAWRFDKAGAWVCLAGLMRYAFIAAARPLPWLRAELPPRRRRQTIAVVQTVGLIVAIAPFIAGNTSRGVLLVCLASLAVSFGIDVRWLAQRRPA
ncbi:MAG: CDP-alcohol phosphatidyltransferase family protein [Pseudomonadota bacterium]